MTSYVMKAWIGNEFDKVVKGKLKEIVETWWFQLFFSCLLEFSGGDEQPEDNGISGEQLVVRKEFIIIARLLSHSRF